MAMAKDGSLSLRSSKLFAAPLEVQVSSRIEQEAWFKGGLTEQENGFSPVCFLKWRVRCSERAKVSLHDGQDRRVPVGAGRVRSIAPVENPSELGRGVAADEVSGLLERTCCELVSFGGCAMVELPDYRK